jgi:hypothetical protein
MYADISRSEVNDLVAKAQEELIQLIDKTKHDLTDLRDYVLKIREKGCEACVPLFPEASGSITAEIGKDSINICTPGKSLSIAITENSEPIVDDFTIHQIGTARYLPGLIAILEKQFLNSVMEILSEQPNFDNGGDEE